MRPLDGIRVIDFTHIVAGPSCTSLMGDMGADVIKVERPGAGDDSRHYDQVFPGADSSYFMGVNRSKRSMTLNLHTPEGVAIAQRLAASADVLIESFRVGVLERLGLGYERLRKENTRLVYCSISAFGPTGPLARKPGMDLLVQSMSGLMGLTGERGRPPAKAGIPVSDFLGAYLALAGILMALRVRDAQGTGQKVDVSLLDATLAATSNYIVGFHATGRPDGPSGSGHPVLVPYQSFLTADRYLTVACLTEDMWRRFCKAIGRPELAEDGRFNTNARRNANREVLVPMLEGVLRQRTAGEWSAVLDAADVPSGPVNGLGEILAHPQVTENGMVHDVSHPIAGPLKLPGIPVKLHATPGAIAGPPPLLGEHTKAVLEELGYGAGEMEGLLARGII